MGGNQSNQSSKKPNNEKKKEATSPPVKNNSAPERKVTVNNNESTQCVVHPANQFNRLPTRNEMECLRIDSLIKRLLNVTNQRLTITVPEEELLSLCLAAKEVFKSQAMCLELEPPLVIIGDTHGQYADLLRIFAHHGFPPKVNYLFLGDYVDRGAQSIETIALLLCYKIKYPESFFLLRGNHESNPLINICYGFYKECKRRYMTDRLFQTIQDTFRYMPFTALVGEKILCMHGGISPHLVSLDQLRQLPRPNVLNYTQRENTTTENLSLDLIWSDPSPFAEGWAPNLRGTSITFGEDVFNEVCQKLGIELVARAHQVVANGYEVTFGGKLITIFSAPHYMGHYNNAAGTLVVDENLRCSIVVFKKRI